MTDDIHIPSPQPNQNSTSGPRINPAVIMAQHQRIEHIEHHFKGPLPPPEVLGNYEKILPGAAERILSMAEKQSNHRQSMEKRIIYSETFQAKLGMVFAFLIVIVALTAGLLLTLNNRPVGGLVSLIAAVGVIVSTFILRRNAEKKPTQPPQSPAKN